MTELLFNFKCGTKREKNFENNFFRLFNFSLGKNINKYSMREINSKSISSNKYIKLVFDKKNIIFKHPQKKRPHFQIEEKEIFNKKSTFNIKKYETDIKAIILFFEHFENDNIKWNKLLPNEYKYLSEMVFEKIKQILEELKKNEIYDYLNKGEYFKLFTSLYDKKEAIDFLLYKIDKDFSILYDKYGIYVPTNRVITEIDIQDTEDCVKIFRNFKLLKDNFRILNYIKMLDYGTIFKFINYSKIYTSIIKLDKNYEFHIDKMEFLKAFGFKNIDEMMKNELNAKNQIGLGGSSTTYKIFNKIDKKYYLLKKIDNTKLSEFENESAILKNNNHENVVKLYYSFKEEQNYFIIMEYCEISDLSKFIEKFRNKNESINDNVILFIALDICRGLKEIHNKNIIHRDLKPQNIFISNDYKIKIGDFGISKKLERTKNAKTCGIGTFSYMAPEHLSINKYNNKVDIWSLGCIIYELVTLNVCFDYEYIGEWLEKIKNVDYDKNLLKKYDNKWENLINKLLQKNPEDRPDINEVYKKVNDLVNKTCNIEKNILNSLDDISYNILKRNIKN